MFEIGPLSASSTPVGKIPLDEPVIGARISPASSEPSVGLFKLVSAPRRLRILANEITE